MPNQSGNKFPSFYTYYIYNTKNILYNNINNNSLNTNEHISNISNNINSENFDIFKSLFTNLMVDCEFDFVKYSLPLLIVKVAQSKFLRGFISLKGLLAKYDEIIKDKYKDLDFKGIKNSGDLVVRDKKDIGIQKAFCSRNYTEKELNNCFDDLDQINL